MLKLEIFQCATLGQGYEHLSNHPATSLLWLPTSMRSEPQTNVSSRGQHQLTHTPMLFVPVPGHSPEQYTLRSEQKYLKIVLCFPMQSKGYFKVMAIKIVFMTLQRNMSNKGTSFNCHSRSEENEFIIMSSSEQRKHKTTQNVTKCNPYSRDGVKGVVEFTCHA